MKRIDKIRAKLTEVVEQAIDKRLIDHMSIEAQDNQTGEPSIYVAITMKARNDAPKSREQSDLTHRLVLALEEMEDERFPYLYVLALDDVQDDGDGVVEPPKRKASRR